MVVFDRVSEQYKIQGFVLIFLYNCDLIMNTLEMCQTLAVKVCLVNASLNIYKSRETQNFG